MRYSYETLAKMYSLRDRIAADTTGNSSAREDQVQGIEFMIHKIERQIAQYLAAHPEKAA